MHQSLESHLGVITCGGPLPQPQGPAPVPSETTASLNRLLRHELAAIDAYERVGGILHQTKFSADFDLLHEGHRQRSNALHVLLFARHAQPATGPGLWGIVVLVAENTASLLGTRMVIATLHELEQRGVADYLRELSHVDELTRAQIESELLPPQEQAFVTISGMTGHPLTHVD